MQTKKPNQEEAIKKLSPKQALKIVKRDQYHDMGNEKMKELTLGYFSEAKDNIREKDKLFDKYKKEWVKFCMSMNATQKLVRFIPGSFKERIDFIIAHAERMNAQEKEAKKTKIIGLDGNPINS